MIENNLKEASITLHDMVNVDVMYPRENIVALRCMSEISSITCTRTRRRRAHPIVYPNNPLIISYQ